MKVMICLLLTSLAVAIFTVSVSAQLKPSDLKILTGGKWTGELTYLDYRSQKKVSIKSNLTVTRETGSDRAWNFAYQYPDEPKADSRSRVELSPDGKTFNGETIVEKQKLPGKTLKIVTTQAGTDNNQPALFRYTYLINKKSFSRKKEVRYEGGSEFFERNEYRWNR